MVREQERRAAPPGRFSITLAALLALGALLKIVLLLTSQSMADGDEAVEGLMALQILRGLGHPIYAWGTHYGAGVFVETHLAAGLFALFGSSDVALKSAGLIVWCGCLGAVGAIGRRLGGPGAGLAAAVLFAFSPAAAQWSLKVAGGHLVAVLLALLALWLVERRSNPLLVAPLLPLAVFAHPIALSLAAALGVLLVLRAGRARGPAVAVWLIVVSAGVALLLRPGGASVWNPVSRGLEPLTIAAAFPRMLVTLFVPNLSTKSWPELAELVPALLWLGLSLVALARVRRTPALLLYAAAPLGMLFVVNAQELVARHVIILWPIACVVLAVGLSTVSRRAAAAVLGLLVASGAAVQLRETASPYVYGPDPQHRGVPRAQTRLLLAELRQRGIRHVYCTDPMYQWNLTWGSRGRIVARWFDPRDRVPRYPAMVDRARLAGRPVALVTAQPGLAPDAPQSFRLIFDPDDVVIERFFPRSPLVGAPDEP